MKSPRTATVAVAIIAFLVLVVLPIGLSWTAYRKASADDRKIAAEGKTIDALNAKIKALHDQLNPPPSREDDAAKKLAARIALGTIAKGSGKGITWALERQIVADPAFVGYTGDVNDKATVGHYAAVLCIRAGKCDWRFGAGIRSRGGVAYVLQEDAKGNLQIAEYDLTNGTAEQAGKAPSPTAVHTLAPTIAASQFMGASPTTGKKLPVAPYEYVHFPGE
ncbi:MAG TPA: hypothetical protein VMA75_03625 [Candidatus Paceibacterota bacterium]|nr:hypothetical protein [Candidatus Paceibacterota bacterium]